MSTPGSTLIPNKPQLLKRSFYHFGTFIKIKTNRKLYSIRTNYYWTNFYDYIPHLREVPFNHPQFTSQWSEKFSLIVLNSSDFSYLQHHPLIFSLTNLILVLTWIWISIPSHHTRLQIRWKQFPGIVLAKSLLTFHSNYHWLAGWTNWIARNVSSFADNSEKTRRPYMKFKCKYLLYYLPHHFVAQINRGILEFWRLHEASDKIFLMVVLALWLLTWILVSICCDHG